MELIREQKILGCPRRAGVKARMGYLETRRVLQPHSHPKHTNHCRTHFQSYRHEQASLGNQQIISTCFQILFGGGDQ